MPLSFVYLVNKNKLTVNFLNSHPTFVQCIQWELFEKRAIIGKHTVIFHKNLSNHVKANEMGGIVMTVSRHDINRERTIRSIEEAFLKEYASKGIEGISITSLCKNSGVSRSTFYLYFDDKYAVLESVEKRLLDGFLEANKDMPYVTAPDQENAHPQQVIRFVKDNKEWFKAILGPHGDPGFTYRWKKVITYTLDTRLADKKIKKVNSEIQGAIFSSGLIGLFTYLLFEQPDVSDDVIGRYMTRLLGFSLKL